MYRFSPQSSLTLQRTKSRVQIPNFTRIFWERYKSWVEIFYATGYSITVAEPIFTKLVLVKQLFVKSYHTELHENLKNALDADTRSQTDRRMWPPHKSFFFTTPKKVRLSLYHCVIYWVCRMTFKHTYWNGVLLQVKHRPSRTLQIRTLPNITVSTATTYQPTSDATLKLTKSCYLNCTRKGHAGVAEGF